MATAEDCSDGAAYLASLGFNSVMASGNCGFGGPGDSTEAGVSLLPLGDHGCVAPLPDGGCLPTHPVALGSDAQDQGSCTISGAGADARSLSRPWDGPPIDADDGCDAGAYESRDEDEGVGDGVEDGGDNCPATMNPDQAGRRRTSRRISIGISGTSRWKRARRRRSTG